MLTLPEDWRQCTAGTSARAILSQADDLREYRTAARLLTRACFELLRDSFWGSVAEGGPHILFAERIIRITDFVFLIADAADDAMLDQATHLVRTAYEVEVLAPPGTQELIKQALISLRASRVTVKSLDDYVELRAMFTGLDTGAGHPAVLSDLLLRYSKLCEGYGAPHLAVSRDGLHPLPLEQLQRNRRRIAPRLIDASEAASAIAVVKRRDDPINLDTSRRIAIQTCELCGAKWDNDDGWDGLCPECADLVSNLLDELRLTDEDRDEIVGRLQAVVRRALRANGDTGSTHENADGI